MASPLDGADRMRAVPWQDHERLRALLAKGAGPSYWYLPLLPPLEGPNGKDLAWADGDLVAVGAKAAPLLTVRPYVWLHALGRSRLLAVRNIPDGKGIGATHLRVTSFDTRKLEPLTPKQRHARRDPVRWAKGALDNVDIPLSLPAGDHPFQVPSSFEGAEVLFADSLYLDAAGKERHVLILLDRASNRLRVVDIRWFIEGHFDLGYQWITRVARDPVTGWLVGGGIRIPDFLMDPVTGEFGQWLAGPDWASVRTNPWDPIRPPDGP